MSGVDPFPILTLTLQIKVFYSKLLRLLALDQNSNFGSVIFYDMIRSLKKDNNDFMGSN